ncbi:unnamed protein product [Ambrosiozyma monospora]|uniref:Unnamed protein product n=1 Tax=Ambrosiozyma monospora TaxID=43982 RepID=A0A9W6T3Y5_AMBMO|nr:unnamed protein product [Ambrosiozyma monospora]
MLFLVRLTKLMLSMLLQSVRLVIKLLRQPLKMLLKMMRWIMSNSLISQLATIQIHSRYPAVRTGANEIAANTERVVFPRQEVSTNSTTSTAPVPTSTALVPTSNQLVPRPRPRSYAQKRSLTASNAPDTHSNFNDVDMNRPLAYNSCR